MLIIDVETTGLDPKKHSIVSIGAVNFYNPTKQFYGECSIWEGAEITEIALKINGFSKEEITDPNKQTLEELMKSFLRWVEPAKAKTIAGQNPYYDRDMLRSSAERCQLPWPLGRRIVDLHSVCYTQILASQWEIPLKDDNTADLGTPIIYSYVGLPSEPDPHNALTGAKMEAEAFCRLINKNHLLDEFNHYKLPEYLR